jgi:hypothetical protein
MKGGYVLKREAFFIRNKRTSSMNVYMIVFIYNIFSVATILKSMATYMGLFKSFLTQHNIIRHKVYGTN